MYIAPPSTLPPGSVVDSYRRDSGGSRQDRSVGQQLAELQSYCAQWRLSLRHNFVDEAKSGGSTAGRDDFNRMVDLYEDPAHRPTGLLLWNFARFARDVDDAQLNKILIRQGGVIIHSLNDPIPEGHWGRFIEFTIDMANEEKKIQTGIDAKRGLRDLVEKFGCVPGSTPRGFKRERVATTIDRDGNQRYGHRWIVDPDMAPRILKAFQMRAAGESLGRIQAETHLYNSINSYVTFWPNKIYYGTLVFGDDYIKENYCEAIVPRELWDKVQEVQNHFTRWKHMKTPGSIAHPRRVNSRFLLSGLIGCGKCGSPMWGHSSKQKNGSINDSYYCTRAYRNRDCSKRRIPRIKIEQKVINLMRDVVLQP